MNVRVDAMKRRWTGKGSEEPYQMYVVDLRSHQPDLSGRGRESKRVSDEVRSTCAQAQLAECLVNQRMVGGTSVFGRVVVVVCVRMTGCVGWLFFRG